MRKCRPCHLCGFLFILIFVAITFIFMAYWDHRKNIYLRAHKRLQFENNTKKREKNAKIRVLGIQNPGNIYCLQSILEEPKIQDLLPRKGEDNLFTIQPKESIDAALKHYASETREYPKNFFKCPHCDQATAGKIEVMTTLPDILALQIQRIRENDNAAGKDSNHAKVEKDMTPVQLTRTINSSLLNTKSEQTTNEIYDLTGVICHLEGINGGHWVAFVKDGKNWFEYNDRMTRNGWTEMSGSIVKRVSESRVLNEKQANILLYKRSQPNGMLQGI